MKKMLSLGLLFVALAPFATFGNDKHEIRSFDFKGGIGVDPVSNVVVSAAIPPVTTVTPNTVRGVSPAGQIWRIADLHAEVSNDGHIRVHGRGLLLAGGNGIGTNGGQSVFATLFCGPAASATAFSTNLTGVALDSDGDFTIDDVLSPLPRTLAIRLCCSSGRPGELTRGSQQASKSRPEACRKPVVSQVYAMDQDGRGAALVLI